MKQLLIVFIVFSFATVVYPQNGTASDDLQVIEYLVTGTGTINLRSGAGTSFGTAGTVNEGDTILIYDEEPEVEGWLRVKTDDESVAYVADFLVERAPMRFYNVNQKPIAVIEGVGSDVSDIIELPAGAYRFDAMVNDNEFVLSSVTVQGDCDDENSIIWEWNYNATQLDVSALFVSSGCSFLFESDTDGAWRVEVRDLFGMNLTDTLLIESGDSINGVGTQLTMGTMLEKGIWTITANVDDTSFSLYSRAVKGCEEELVMSDYSSDEPIELRTIYRVDGDVCITFWETPISEGAWELIFEKVN